MHIAALKNPAMRGGPFINHDETRVDEIRDLLFKTKRELAHILKFAEAIKTLDEILATSEGESLEATYRKIPDVLCGYVELVYDLNHRASIRFLEGVLYRSPNYRRQSQSLMLSVLESDCRPFFMSTPVLPSGKSIHVQLPFDDEGVDKLLRLESTPLPPEHIAELAGIEAQSLQAITTSRAPRISPRYSGQGIRIRYFGHACLLIETRDVSILTDPVISYDYPSEVFRYTIADLPNRIDYVLITHNHQDHLSLETLLRLRHRIGNIIVPRSGSGNIADPSIKWALHHVGFRNVAEIAEFEELDIPDGVITAVPFLGEHADLNICSKTGYVVELNKYRVMCVADSNNVEPKLYALVKEICGDVDLLFAGMECEGGPMSWLYGPLFTHTLARRIDQARRLNGSNCEKVLAMVEAIGARNVFIYAMGQEPWLNHLTSVQYTDESLPIVESDRLLRVCNARGLPAERLFGHREILIDSPTMAAGSAS